MNLAILEGVITLVRIMDDFDMKLVPGQTIQRETSLTSPMRYGMFVEMRERNS
ncbi:hypothetical protein K7432_017552 [Basidiobolus ranarum]|uniref:Uncharacterized protein n=1 Tax=Basidiobolus ranarum TaxID=34480 RepID=A0ABR2VKH6_9FUNG